jgi:hypothetical protein
LDHIGRIYQILQFKPKESSLRKKDTNYGEKADTVGAYNDSVFLLRTHNLAVKIYGFIRLQIYKIYRFIKFTDVSALVLLMALEGTGRTLC